MRRLLRILALACCGLLLPALGMARAEGAELGIAPVIQQTPEWCWAAAAEMVLGYYRFPNLNPAGNYQCAIVGAQGGQCSQNCTLCISGGGTTQRIALVIRQYAELARAMTGAFVAGFNPRTTGILSAREIAASIDRGAPLLAGISPQAPPTAPGMGLSRHAVVVEGYLAKGDSFGVIVNDPFPYSPTLTPPYLSVGGATLQPGQFVVPYRAFVQYLHYENTIVFD
jgi:hypothetical protein